MGRAVHQALSRQRLYSVQNHRRNGLALLPVMCLLPGSGASSHRQAGDDVPYSTLHEDDEQFVVNSGVVSGVVSTIEPNQAEVSAMWRRPCARCMDVMAAGNQGVSIHIIWNLLLILP